MLDPNSNCRSAIINCDLYHLCFCCCYVEIPRRTPAQHCFSLPYYWPVCLLSVTQPLTAMWSCRSWRREMSRSCLRKCCCFLTEAVKYHRFLYFSFSIRAFCLLMSSLTSCPLLSRRPCVYVQTHAACTALSAQVSAGCFRQPRDGWHLLPHWHDGDDWHCCSADIWPFTWRQGETWRHRTATDCSQALKEQFHILGNTLFFFSCIIINAFNGQIWDRNRCSHPTLGKKALFLKCETFFIHTGLTKSLFLNLIIISSLSLPV